MLQFSEVAHFLDLIKILTSNFAYGMNFIKNARFPFVKKWYIPISVQELLMRHWSNTCSITLRNTSTLPQHVPHTALGVCIYTWTCHITSILISFTSSDFLPNFSLSPIQPTSLFTSTFFLFCHSSFLLIVLSKSKNLTAAHKNKNKTPCLPPPFSFSGRTGHTSLFIQTCLSLGIYFLSAWLLLFASCAVRKIEKLTGRAA